MFQVYGNQLRGLCSAGVGLGQQIFIASNLRQPGLKSCPLAGYKKVTLHAINVFQAPRGESLVWKYFEGRNN